MKKTPPTAARVSAKVANLAKKGTSALVANLGSIIDTVDAAPGVVFIPGRDSVEGRCNLYQAGLGALKATAGLVEATEKLTGSDLSESKGKIKAAENDLNGRRDALGC